MEESRLGIPVLFGHDVIHGFRTVYPISIAQACSWNPALVEKACAMAAREARLAGLDWTFSPMIDVRRPQWHLPDYEQSWQLHQWLLRPDRCRAA